MIIIVVSDLHVAAGPLDDCDAEIEQSIVEFILSLAARNEPIELVINGDFLDFVQAPPYIGPELEGEGDGIPLCFTEMQSVAKLRAIVAAHPSIFAAIGE